MTIRYITCCLLIVACAPMAYASLDPLIGEREFRAASATLAQELGAHIKKTHTAPPLIGLTPIRNTTSEHIDTGLFASLLTRELLTYGIKVRNERHRADHDAKPSADPAALLLSGEIRGIWAVDGENRVCTTFIILTLTDAKTRMILWTKDVSFRRIVPKRSLSF